MNPILKINNIRTNHKGPTAKFVFQSDNKIFPFIISCKLDKGFNKKTKNKNGIPSVIKRFLRKGPGPLRSYEAGMKYPEIKKKNPIKYA